MAIKTNKEGRYLVEVEIIAIAILDFVVVVVTAVVGSSSNYSIYYNNMM